MRISRLKLLVLTAMSLFGLWSSGMVVVVYYLLNESLPFCPSSTVWGIALDCNKVLGSSYSTIFGIPLELLAVVYFVVNLLLVFFVALGSERLFEKSIDVLFVWRFIGILIVPYLVFVELLLIKAICVYCTVMHVAIVADFLIISYLLFFREGGLYEAKEPVGQVALEEELPSGGPGRQTRNRGVRNSPDETCNSSQTIFRFENRPTTYICRKRPNLLVKVGF